MKPTETGEFRIDEEAMEGVLSMDRKKLWKHRAGLVWEELLAPIILSEATALVVGIVSGGLVLCFFVLACIRIAHWIFGSSSDAVTAAGGITATGGAVCGLVSALYLHEQGHFKRLKNNWTPPTLKRGKE